MQTWKAVLSSVMIGAFGAAAVAQDAPARGGQPPARERPGRGGGEGQGQPPRGDRPGGGGGMGRQQLSPEKAKAAWDVEAKGVAKRLGLSDTQATALAKAYADARTAENEAFEKARKEMQDKAGDGEENGGRRPQVANEKREEIQATERAKFEKALTGAGISGDQASKAVASLGTFNRQWDVMADAVAGFGLEAGKQQEALNAIESYILAASKARAAMSGGGDREEAMTAMRDAREKLTTTMKKVLSEDQFGKFEASMGPGRGQGRAGGGGEGDAPRPRRNREGGDNGGEGRRPGDDKPKSDKPGGGGR